MLRVVKGDAVAAVRKRAEKKSRIVEEGIGNCVGEYEIRRSETCK